MALIHFFFMNSLIILPLLIMASAIDYDTHSSKPDENTPKSENHTSARRFDGKQKSKSGDYDYSRKPELDRSKLDQGYDKDLKKAESEYNSGYDDNPNLDQGYDKDINKVESEDKSKLKSHNTRGDTDKSKLDQGYDKDLKKAESEDQGYVSQLDKSKSEDQNYYKSKLDLDKLKSENKPKLENCGYHSKPYYEKAKTGGHGYGPKPDLSKSKSKDKPQQENHSYDSKSNVDNSKSENQSCKSKLDDDKSEVNSYGPKLEEKEKSFLIRIQGLVLCQSGRKYYPIPGIILGLISLNTGAVARITCLVVEENEYETKSVFNCRSTSDAKGYFFAALSPLQLTNGLKLIGCKAFLEKSPSETCKIPKDVNKRISGALLASYRILNDKKLKLYSLKPFIFTSEPESNPTGY